MGSIDSNGEAMKGHILCIPFPAQGHLNPMLKLAKILNNKGFYITFVNTEYNHKRLLRSRGSESFQNLPASFRFETIPDGLPPSDVDATQDVAALCYSIPRTCGPPFRELVARLNNGGSPPVSGIVSDSAMNFTLEVAREFGIPEVLFWTCSASAHLCFMNFHLVIEKGYAPLKDSSYLTNGYLDTELDFVKGLPGIRMRDLPSFIRAMSLEEPIIQYIFNYIEKVKSCSAIIINTFDKLEHEALEALGPLLPPVYPIGPVHLMEKPTEEDDNNNDIVKSLGLNLWKEDATCLEWLDTKEPNSVVYVNFGSITVMTPDQLLEFAWGLANSKKSFLWILRPDLVSGDEAVLPPEFLQETEHRGMIGGWCPQERVLSHPALGGFLTHSGWNSTLESITNGLPMICWPFFADQQTNCWVCCTHLGIGMEIESDVKRDEIERLVRELMDGEKGKEMKKRALELKKLAEDAITPTGSSCFNLEQVITKFLS